MPEELWTDVRDIVQEEVTKTIPKKKKGKMVVRGGLTKPSKEEKLKAKEKRKDIPI